MSTRVTKAQLDEALHNLTEAMRVAGIYSPSTTYRGSKADTVTLDYRHVVVMRGTPTYGRVWTIYYRHPEHGGHASMPWDSVLGWTAREALATLRALTAGIQATITAQKVAAREQTEEGQR